MPRGQKKWSRFGWRRQREVGRSESKTEQIDKEKNKGMMEFNEE